MERFFESVLDRNVLKKSIPLLEKQERYKLRALRSDLRRNDELREDINSGKISLEKIINLPFEELANKEMKEKRQLAKKENLLSVLREKVIYTREEIDVIVNKIDDP